ncbi:hypothetical protein EDD16DRAFT_1221411 [Pisolithus croceorrhizus]|nr:hypothetical protein EDD16DRAFT_1221411 [Pisolithus croceorrhizus]
MDNLLVVRLSEVTPLVFTDLQGLVLDGAQSLVKEHGLTEQDLLRRFTTTIDDALSLGLTSTHDACFRPASLVFFERLASCMRC